MKQLPKLLKADTEKYFYKSFFFLNPEKFCNKAY